MKDSFTYPVTADIVSEETSATMRGILEMVVKEGSGKNGKVEGYRVGGKTATSQTLSSSAYSLPVLISRDAHPAASGVRMFISAPSGIMLSSSAGRMCITGNEHRKGVCGT